LNGDYNFSIAQEGMVGMIFFFKNDITCVPPLFNNRKILVTIQHSLIMDADQKGWGLVLSFWKKN
jgi:hypothetical protein